MDTRYDYVLIGSFAAVWAAQTIRKYDASGTIAIFTAEGHPPYDRPPLSKDYLVKDEVAVDDAYSKFDDFYPKNDIALHVATPVAAINRTEKTITLKGGDAVGYGKLLLATGASPRSLSVPGSDRSNVLRLHTLDESLALRKALSAAKRLVVVGAGYIGMEVASAGVAHGIDVTVIDPAEHPWARFAGPELGGFLRRYFEKQGVKFCLNDEVTYIEAPAGGGLAAGVTTKAGRTLPADLIVVGIGVTLNTELARAAGLELGERGGVKVDEFLQTSDPDILAAGDIAYFNDLAVGKQWHVEHHQNAKWQGETAGKVMTGNREPYDQIPYFFSDLLDLHMILRGDPYAGRTSVFAGDLDGAEFVELQHDAEGRLTLGIAVSRDESKLDPCADTLERLIRARTIIAGREAEIQATGFDISTL